MIKVELKRAKEIFEQIMVVLIILDLFESCIY